MRERGGGISNIKLVNKSGFKVLKYFADKKNYFGVFLLKVK